MIFQKNDVVELKGKKHRVICCDEEMAVLARYGHSASAQTSTTNYQELCAVSNQDMLADIIRPFKIIGKYPRV